MKIWSGFTLPKIHFKFSPEMKLRGLVPNSYIHVAVSDQNIPRIGIPIWMQQNRQTDPGNIYKLLNRYMNG